MVGLEMVGCDQVCLWVGNFKRLRTTCGREWLSGTEYVFELEKVKRLRSDYGWKWLYVAKEEIGRQVVQTRSRGIEGEWRSSVE